MQKVHRDGPGEILSMGRRGVYQVSLSINDHWDPLESLLRKYQQQGVSLADACLIRCADVFAEPRIATFDSDFDVYRWARQRAFDVL
jgi:predicted nucleic acid-binding protein